MPTKSKSQFSIGVFDSGLGGLTVVKQLRALLPHENIVYYGDTARVPYGTKSKDAIIRFSKENTQILLKHNVKCVVVACNSCSSYAMRALKTSFQVPVIGVLVPGAKKAALQTATDRVGVVATSATIASGKYAHVIKKFNKKAKVVSQACPLFVPLVEEGWLTKRVAEDIAAIYLKDLKKARVDTLILGCTHYPLLKKTLKKVMGSKVVLVDSAKEVAAEVKEILRQKNLINGSKKKGNIKFLVSDKPQEFKKIARSFLGFDLHNVKQVKGV